MPVQGGYARAPGQPDKVMDVREAIFASRPGRDLVANVDTRVIRKAPAEHVDHDVEKLGGSGLFKPLPDSRLDESMHRQIRRLSCSLNESCTHEFFRSIAEAVEWRGSGTVGVNNKGG